MDHGSIHLMPSTYAQHAILMPYWACAVLMPSMQYLCLVLPSISRAIGHFSSFCNSKHTLDKNDQTNSLSSASFAPSGLPSKNSSASDTPWVKFFQTTPAAFPQSVPNLASRAIYSTEDDQLAVWRRPARSFPARTLAAGQTACGSNPAHVFHQPLQIAPPHNSGGPPWLARH